jgi:hypothetical protein
MGPQPTFCAPPTARPNALHDVYGLSREVIEANAARTFIPYPTLLFDATGRLTGAINMLVEK